MKLEFQHRNFDSNVSNVFAPFALLTTSSDAKRFKAETSEYTLTISDEASNIIHTKSVIPKFKHGDCEICMVGCYFSRKLKYKLQDLASKSAYKFHFPPLHKLFEIASDLLERFEFEYITIDSAV